MMKKRIVLFSIFALSSALFAFGLGFSITQGSSGTEILWYSGLVLLNALLAAVSVLSRSTLQNAWTLTGLLNTSVCVLIGTVIELRGQGSFFEPVLVAGLFLGITTTLVVHTWDTREHTFQMTKQHSS